MRSYYLFIYYLYFNIARCFLIMLSALLLNVKVHSEVSIKRKPNITIFSNWISVLRLNNLEDIAFYDLKIQSKKTEERKKWTITVVEFVTLLRIRIFGSDRMVSIKDARLRRNTMDLDQLPGRRRIQLHGFIPSQQWDFWSRFIS